MDVRLPDGTLIQGVPEGMSKAELTAKLKANGMDVSSLEASPPGMLASAGMGLARGVKDVIDTGAQALASGFDKLAGTTEGERVKAMNAAGKDEFKREYGDSTTASIARVGGNIAATLPITAFAGAATGAAGLPALGNAIASGGMRLGGSAGPNALANMATRSAGGAIGGYLSAGAVDPASANTGAVIGGVLPPLMQGVTAVAKGVGSVIRPFYSAGQDKIAAGAMRDFATDPNRLAAVGGVAPVIPNSMPTTVMAAGDEGLAGLSRTMQSTSPNYAAELSSRQAAQNAARTAALEGVAGNTGKIAIAKEARDAATAPMREAVLDAAGKVQARPVLDRIDRLITSPENAGELSQQALNKFRDRIAKFSPDGQIDARALYEIRKDVNTLLQGKLQGEAGNLRYASGQLGKIKDFIDDAIDQASRAVTTSESRAVMPYGANIARSGEAMGSSASMAPRPSWKQYLQTYASQSRPIERMELMDDVLKSIQTGTVDQGGNAVLSAAKLNNLLKNRGPELIKQLEPQQLDLLRKLAADLNASQLANNAGKAVGSNTVQNLAQANVLNNLLGPKLGGSTPSTSILGRLMQLPYGTANKQISEKLGNALIDPQEAQRLNDLLNAVPRNKLAEVLSPAAELSYRAAPVIPAR